jgi:hypothetical protein
MPIPTLLLAAAAENLCAVAVYDGSFAVVMTMTARAGIDSGCPGNTARHVVGWGCLSKAIITLCSLSGQEYGKA